MDENARVVLRMGHEVKWTSQAILNNKMRQRVSISPYWTAELAVFKTVLWINCRYAHLKTYLPISTAEFQNMLVNRK